MKRSVLLLVLFALVVCGCTTTEKGAAVGATAGSVLGGIIGHQSGHGVAGAAIGAGVGGVTGAIVGEKMDKKFCPVCGVAYPNDVQFCPKDGTELKLKQ